MESLRQFGAAMRIVRIRGKLNALQDQIQVVGNIVMEIQGKHTEIMLLILQIITIELHTPILAPVAVLGEARSDSNRIHPSTSRIWLRYSGKSGEC